MEYEQIPLLYHYFFIIMENPKKCSNSIKNNMKMLFPIFIKSGL